MRRTKRRLCAGAIAAMLLLTSSVASVSAHPGRTDANGGHTCRTNCEKWGLEYGEYHYHNGGGSSKSKSNSSKSKSKTTTKSTTTTKSKSTTKSKNTTPSKSKPAAPAYAKSGLVVYVNGTKLSFDSDPLIYENTNLLPLREIAEAMGASVTWDKQGGTITVEKEDRKMILKLGSKTVYYNGKAGTASTAPKVIQGTTYVPAQVFARGLGGSVAFDSSTNTLDITYE
ncbi:copper amine oxidase N-terminal domain-containing protein [Paenibacillus lutimineralis]|uniref:Copper amine oxidase N-terminal domain-containing protein n=1 Tax=Paenibacillus lutimineralis TaxID=2707005 RepID=A0A3S9UYF1_9BACL|nr:copper amine oxidase N-terminal domain-containing protein [Paenibacillus lutimineralis]AZS15107.1 copper amine oxidase N-terminal domain-containing protein [Paenibacillus lutimineralis]